MKSKRSTTIAIVIVAVGAVLMLALARVWSRANPPEVVSLVRAKPVSPEVRSIVAAYRLAGICNIGDFERTEAAKIRSPFVITMALRNPSIKQLSIIRSKGHPVAWVHNHLAVELVDDPDVIRVSLRSWNTAEAKMLVDAIVDAYIDEMVAAERLEHQKILNSYREGRRLLAATTSAEELREYERLGRGIAQLKAGIFATRVHVLKEATLSQ